MTTKQLLFILLMKNSSCFRASSALFTIDRNARLLKIKQATIIVHAWEDKSQHFDLANLTGIPSHVTILVEHEKTKKIINSNFVDMRNYVREELDKRQMGGGMTFELIEQRISGPILEKLANVQASLERRVPLDNSSNEPNAMPEFRWMSDTRPVPRLLPEDYILPTTIHPLAMWKQWHHGASFQDGIAVGPLKNIETTNCPKKFERRFELMKKFFKELDKTSGVSGNETIAELGKIFDANKTKWQDLGILLPGKTPTNRTRSRNENGWCYNAGQWEKMLNLREKSAKTRIPVDLLIKEAAEKERLRQKRKREAMKAKKAAEVNENAETSENRKTPTQRQRMNSRREFRLSAAVATRLNNLLN